jgi:chromosomal replication initiation ATPase DnaA
MQRPSQLILDLPARPALGRSDFYVSPANRLALAQIDTWPRWPSGRLVIAGPAASGKTHLVHVWAVRAQARIVPAASLPGLDPGAVPGDAALAVEDADCLSGLGAAARKAEETLFHLCNLLTAGGGALLLTGRDAPSRWTLRLPDLASRLRAAPVATLEPPDDALLAAVLVKLFADRGIGVAPEVIRYLAARMERSFTAAEDVVARLDRAGLARGRAIGLRLAAEVLASGAEPR